MLTTEKDSYLLPNIENTFNTLAGAKNFSSLDLASGYWQVELEDETKAKMAFANLEGLSQFTVMLFGLCNAPATYELLTECVLNGLLWGRCMRYLDGIILHSLTFQLALDNLKTVIEVFEDTDCGYSPRNVIYCIQEGSPLLGVLRERVWSTS